MKKKIAISAVLAVLSSAFAVWARWRTLGLGIYTLNTTLGKVLIHGWRPAAVLALVMWVLFGVFVSAWRKMKAQMPKETRAERKLRKKEEKAEAKALEKAEAKAMKQAEKESKKDETLAEKEAKKAEEKAEKEAKKALEKAQKKSKKADKTEAEFCTSAEPGVEPDAELSTEPGTSGCDAQPDELQTEEAEAENSEPAPQLVRSCFCAHCGAPMKVDQKFCVKCGAKAGEEATL